VALTHCGCGFPRGVAPRIVFPPSWWRVLCNRNPVGTGSESFRPIPSGRPIPHDAARWCGGGEGTDTAGPSGDLMPTGVRGGRWSVGDGPLGLRRPVGEQQAGPHIHHPRARGPSGKRGDDWGRPIHRWGLTGITPGGSGIGSLGTQNLRDGDLNTGEGGMPPEGPRGPGPGWPPSPRPPAGPGAGPRASRNGDPPGRGLATLSGSTLMGVHTWRGGIEHGLPLARRLPRWAKRGQRRDGGGGVSDSGAATRAPGQPQPQARRYAA